MSPRMMTPEEIGALPHDERRQTLAVAAAARRNRIARARTDASTFCEVVLRDEQRGTPIHQAPLHQRWHELIDSHVRLVLWSGVDLGKTTSISVGRTLYEVGKNPNLRVAIISKTNDLAMNITRAIGQYIEKSEELHEVFPHLVPAKDPSLPWTAHSLTVARQVRAKDPTVRAAGVYGNIHGSRIDLLILDDIIDHVNTKTATPREHLWQWIRSTLFGRLSEHARVIAMGNAWHPDDVLHRFSKEPRFVAFKFPVVSSTGDLAWPEHWPRSRIDNARADMGPMEFSRALLCQARDDETSPFPRDIIERCLAAGQGKRLVSNSTELVEALVAEGELPAEVLATAHALASARALGRELEILDPLAAAGIGIATGVDLAVQQHDAADLTSIFTIAAFPDGRRRVLRIESGRWGASEIMRRIAATWRAFGGIVVVENVAAQDYIVQLLREQTAVPVVPFTTGRQKAHPEFGFAALSAEFAAAKWVIPCAVDGTERGREVDAWITELTGYDPNGHTGDRAMASWFAREGVRTVGGGARVRARVLSADGTEAGAGAGPGSADEALRYEEDASDRDGRILVGPYD